MPTTYQFDPILKTARSSESLPLSLPKCHCQSSSLCQPLNFASFARTSELASAQFGLVLLPLLVLIHQRRRRRRRRLNPKDGRTERGRKASAGRHFPRGVGDLLEDRSAVLLGPSAASLARSLLSYAMQSSEILLKSPTLSNDRSNEASTLTL